MGMKREYIISIDFIDEPPANEEIIRCKDCAYFEIKDWWVNLNNIPVLAASDCPTCRKWGNDECMTNPEGFCYLAKKRA